MSYNGGDNVVCVWNGVDSKTPAAPGQTPGWLQGGNNQKANCFHKMSVDSSSLLDWAPHTDPPNLYCSYVKANGRTAWGTLVEGCSFAPGLDVPTGCSGIYLSDGVSLRFLHALKTPVLTRATMSLLRCWVNSAWTPVLLSPRSTRGTCEWHSIFSIIWTLSDDLFIWQRQPLRHGLVITALLNPIAASA